MMKKNLCTHLAKSPHLTFDVCISDALAYGLVCFYFAMRMHSDA